MQEGKEQPMGCPFMNKDKADDDPRGKNLLQGYK